MVDSVDDFNYQNRNYPPENDSTSYHPFLSLRDTSSHGGTAATSEGGYSASNTFSTQNQRRADPQSGSQSQTQQQFSPSNTGLIDQSLNGGPIGREVQDAKQGTDERTRTQFSHEARRDFDALNPYGRNPDGAKDMGDRLASGYADQRGRQYESESAAGDDGDAGTL